MQQISIYRIFALDILHGNFTAPYEVDTKYLRITWDETMTMEISDKQYSSRKEANGQFCNIYTLFQPLANLPSCITALYSKNSAIIATRCSLQVRKAHIISIPTLIAPYIWFITSLQPIIQTGITLVSRRTHKCDYTKETHPYLETSTSLQCYIIIFLFTTTL